MKGTAMAASTKVLTTLGLLLLLVAVAGSGDASAQQGQQAQEDKDPIIGTWVLNVANSKYVAGQPAKSIVRTFDYTRDGMILVTLNSVNAQGVASSNHWYMSLDGKEHPEYSRARGATPILWISIKAVDSHTKELTGRRLEGGVMTVVDLMRFSVAKDGRSMTITYTDAKTGKEGNVIAYDRQ
jgi:hypothetical protein